MTEPAEGKLVIMRHDVDELAILGFFNEFVLMDIGIGDFIREVYFED